jgi:serine/threonine-protein kinase
MSPEQAMGRTKEIDHRTDVYALGVIIYEMLTGEVPFSAESFGDLMLKHLQAEPPPLRNLRPDLGEGWSYVVHTALAKQRDQRFGSMADFAAAIAHAGQGGAVPTSGANQPTVAPSRQALAAATPPALVAATPPSHPGTVALPSVAPGGGSRKAILFALAGFVAAAAAVVVLLMSRGGGGAADPVAANLPPDAASVARAIDAGVAAALPPDAAPVVVALPPDAAPKRDPKPKPRPRPDPKPKGKATLVVQATPYGQVFVDGKDYGYTPRTIEVDAGRHKVKIVYDEADKPHVETVNLKPGQKRTVSKKWTR